VDGNQHVFGDGAGRVTSIFGTHGAAASGCERERERASHRSLHDRPPATVCIPRDAGKRQSTLPTEEKMIPRVTRKGRKL
jgi:hypothetical protein